MNFVVYYMNYDGFPRFCFVTGSNVREAKKEFRSWHPDCEIANIFVCVDDVRFAITHAF